MTQSEQKCTLLPRYYITREKATLKNATFSV
jgi:hypothetical protein